MKSSRSSGTNTPKTLHERQRDLALLGRASYASKSAIDKLLKGVARDGLPDTYDRSAQYRARKNLCSTDTNYGRLVDIATLKTHMVQLWRLGFRTHSRSWLTTLSSLCITQKSSDGRSKNILANQGLRGDSSCIRMGSIRATAWRKTIAGLT